MKKITLTFSFLCTTALLLAQSYDSALGIRLGTEWGLTFKQRMAKRATLEGILQHNNKREETTITVLAEKHNPIIIRNVNIYYGGGLHKGWVAQNDEVGYEDPFGLTFIGGAEASLGRINVSWDFKPAINLIGGERTVYAETAVSIRYVINKRELFNRKKKKRKRKKKNKKNDDWKFWKNW